MFRGTGVEDSGVRALTTFLGLKARLGLLGGAVAAGSLALVVYFTPGSAIDTVAAQDVVYFRIGAGAPGSTHYGLAGKIASIISNPPGSRECDGEGACGIEGLLGLAQTTLGPDDSLVSLRQQALEAAIVTADVADAAWRGSGPFKKAGPMEDLRAIANVGSMALHIIVPKESKATELKALAGKKVAIGPADSDNAVSARTLLRAAGLPDKKVKFVNAEIAEAAGHLLNGEIDALAVVDELPSNEVADLMATGNFRMLGAEIVAKDTPGYVFADWIGQNQYAGVDSIRTVAVPAVLVVRADLPGQIADGLLRALWHSGTPAAPDQQHGGITPDMARASVAWHPDAATAFAELSKTTPALPEAAAPTN